MKVNLKYIDVPIADYILSKYSEKNLDSKNANLFGKKKERQDKIEEQENICYA